MNVGDRIQIKMKEKKMSQNRLAKAAQISQSGLSSIISGAVSPKEVTLSAIAKALDCNVSELMGEKEMRQDIQEKLFPNIPRTAEARTVSAGMDELPPEQRQLIVNMVTAMYPDVFKKTKGMVDDDPKL